MFLFGWWQASGDVFRHVLGPLGCDSWRWRIRMLNLRKRHHLPVKARPRDARTDHFNPFHWFWGNCAAWQCDSMTIWQYERFNVVVWIWMVWHWVCRGHTWFGTPSQLRQKKFSTAMRFHPVPGMVCRWHPHIHLAVQPKNFLRKVSRKVLHLPMQVDDTVIAWCWRVFSSRAIPGWNHHRIETTLLGLVGKSSYHIWQLHGGFLQGDAGLLGDSVATMIRWTSIFCICLFPRWWCSRGSRLNTSHCHWTMIVWRMGERGIPKARPWTCIRSCHAAQADSKV